MVSPIPGVKSENFYEPFFLMSGVLSFCLVPAALAADLERYTGKESQLSHEPLVVMPKPFDLKPTDWAYQALTTLLERYGCVNASNGSFQGGEMLTRYEAAALLRACLGRVTEVTDDLKRLWAEFEQELALLGNRADHLEAKAGELEATQFSTTTRLRANTRWVLGGLRYGGNQVSAKNTFKPGGDNAVLRDALTLSYDLRLNFDTSFSGKDLFRIQVRSGNFADSGFSLRNAITPLTSIDAGYEEVCGVGVDCGNAVAINRVYYKFPIGREFTVVLGPRLRQDDGLAVFPSIYNADIETKFLTLSAGGAYSSVLGAGAGAWWKQKKADRKDPSGWSVSGVYVSANGDGGRSSGAGCTNYILEACGGIGNEASLQSGTLQLAYSGKGWVISSAYTYNSAGVPIQGTSFQNAILPNIYRSAIGGGHTNSYAITGYWQPLHNGPIPSITAAWQYNRYIYNGETAASPSPLTSLQLNSASSQSWYVAFKWNGVLGQHNSLGFGLGQPTFVTSISSDLPSSPDKVFDGNYGFELYYKIQVADRIAITPVVFYLSAPRGGLTQAPFLSKNLLANPSKGDASLSAFGALIQATLKF
jgi:Carbohydrate-selective porin, OprB family